MRHAQNFGGFEHRPRKQSEALGIVRIVAGWTSVERLPIKIRRIVHKIKSHPTAASRSHHRAEAILVVERDSNAAYHRLRISKFSLPIAWNIHAHLMSQA